MNAALVMLEVDPNIVRPGWVSALVTVFIAVALVVLFFSLRRQVGRINPSLPYADEVDEDGAPIERTDRPSTDEARGSAGTVPGGNRPAPDITGGNRPAPDITGPKR